MVKQLVKQIILQLGGGYRKVSKAPVSSRCKGQLRSTGQQAGFTLVEVLVTSVLLGVGCVAIILMQITAISSGGQANSLVTATFLAESQVELINSMDFGDVTDINQDPEFLTGSGQPTTNEDDAYYTVTTTIDADNGPTTRSHVVRVHITWPGAGDGLVYQSIITAPNFGF